MKKTYFLFIVLITISSIFYKLYTIDYKIDINIIPKKEVVVFYIQNDEIVGLDLPVKDDNITSIFEYLTVRRNSVSPHLKSPNINVELVSYTIKNNLIELTLSNEYDQIDRETRNNFSILLYESYKIIGYENLVIHTKNNQYNYNRNSIFKVADFTNYKINNIRGNICYIYKVYDDLLNYESIIDSYEDEIIYKLDNIYDNITYEVINKVIKVSYKKTEIDSDDLLKTLQYNFLGYDFTLIPI